MADPFRPGSKQQEARHDKGREGEGQREKEEGEQIEEPVERQKGQRRGEGEKNKVNLL